jgi:hypothetical protein
LHIKFPRIYADKQGETHIGVLDVPEHEARVGPPRNPVGQMPETEAVSKQPGPYIVMADIRPCDAARG